MQLRLLIDRLTEDAAASALRARRGNVAEAARDLGVARSRLYLLLGRSRRLAEALRAARRSGLR